MSESIASIDNPDPFKDYKNFPTRMVCKDPQSIFKEPIEKKIECNNNYIYKITSGEVNFQSDKPIPKTIDKFYYEIQCIKIVQLVFGLAYENFPQTGYYHEDWNPHIGYNKNSIAYQSSWKRIWSNGNIILKDLPTTYISEGDIVGCLYDRTTREVSFIKNGEIIEKPLTFEHEDMDLYPTIRLAGWGSHWSKIMVKFSPNDLFRPWNDEDFNKDWQTPQIIDPPNQFIYKEIMNEEYIKSMHDHHLSNPPFPESGQGERKFLDGGLYSGSFLNFYRHGKGKMIYANGDVYEGDWDTDARKGEGKMIYANGDVYEGSWEKEGMTVGSDMKQGEGKMVYANGDVYEGKWEENMRKRGKMVFINGDIYEGEWYENQKWGENGKMIYANGETYEGKWCFDEKDGEGKMIYVNGDVYEGAWKKGLKECQEKKERGKMSYANGDVYEGKWTKDMKSDQGKMTYSNGDVFEGEWKDDLRLKGSLTYANGDKYTGSFTNDKKHGQGKYIWTNEMFYEGDFEEDQVAENGTFVFGKTFDLEDFESFQVMKEDILLMK